MKTIRHGCERLRLLAALLCVSIIPAVVIGIYANYAYIRLLTGELSDFAEQTVMHLDTALTTELTRYELFIDAVSVSPGVQDSMINRQGGNTLRKEVERVILRKDYFKDLIVLDLTGEVLYDAGFTRVSREDLRELVALIDISSPSDCLYRVTGAPGYLTLGRKVFKFPSGGEAIGYIIAFISVTLPSEMIFDKISFGEGSITLLSADGAILAGSGTMPQGLFERMVLSGRNGSNSFTARIDGVPTFAAFSKGGRYNTYLLASAPLLYINAGTGRVERRIIIIVFAATSAASALSLLIYQSVARARMDDQRRKHSLELTALQYQINPHFLFNTLGTLKWVAVMNEAPPVISEGITSLSRLLQSVLMNKNEMIPLREELSNLTHYFTIQKIRYGDCFNVAQEIDEEALDCAVPRFVLQPLAENAVLHGSQGGERQIVITIRAKQAEGGVRLEIEDNGSGFDPVKAKDESGARFTGIGLSNVDERLKLYFGGGNGLKIDSIIDTGTVCRIFLPDGKEDDNNVKRIIRRG